MLPAKFRYNSTDKEGGVLSRAHAGVVDYPGLSLGNEQLPLERLITVQHWLDRLQVVYVGNDGSLLQRVITIKSGNCRRVHSALSQLISARHAEAHRVALAQAGLEGEYVTQRCQACHATIDLSSKPVTEQIYCRYCDSLTTPAAEATEAADYRICESCGFFDRPREFTTFYYVFLIVVHFHSTKKYVICRNCRRRESWKMLGGNLPGVLGVLPALVQLARSYVAGGLGKSAFAGLDQANALAQNKRIDEAAELYDQIIERIGPSAGVSYSHGLALLQAERLEPAMVQFQRALLACSTYTPAYSKLCECYERLGMRDALEALHEVWSGPGDVGAAAEPAVDDSQPAQAE